MLVVFSDTESKSFREYRTVATELTVEGVQRILALHIDAISTGLRAIVDQGIWNGRKSWTSGSGRYTVEIYKQE